eukprot:12656008-Heterocapsa_arctica.AAC.1
MGAPVPAAVDERGSRPADVAERTATQRGPAANGPTSASGATELIKGWGLGSHRRRRTAGRLNNRRVHCEGHRVPGGQAAGR